MTLGQRIKKAFYPLIMFATGKGKNHLSNNRENKKPPVSFYNLKTVLNNGDQFSFDKLKGKKVLLVNTASNCGYTNQYSELEELYLQEKEKLVILAFPANDFKEQEKGNDAEIAQFCKINFGVTFPLMKKSTVIKNAYQNEVYKWLTDPNKNGWNDKPPVWNFSKYLVNEEGVLVYYFEPGVSPLSTEVKDAIQ